MKKEQVKKDVKDSLTQGVDNIANATKQSTENILEVVVKYGINTIMAQFDNGVEALKTKIDKWIDNGGKKDGT